jgi:hypothetical protein
MSTTFTLPSGAKARTATRRRFALLIEYGGVGGVSIEKRSDSRETLRLHLRRERGKGRLSSPAFIGDTATGEVQAAR